MPPGLGLATEWLERALADVRALAFTHRVDGADELWAGLRDGTVRMRALLFGQPEETLARIRAAFDRLVGEYAAEDGGLELPVSVKVASGRK